MKLRDLAGGTGHAGIVTRGADGVVVAAPDGTLYEGVLYVRGRYPVGSGDAFLAGLVVGLDGDRGWPGRARGGARGGTGERRAAGRGPARSGPCRRLVGRAQVRRLELLIRGAERTVRPAPAIQGLFMAFGFSSPRSSRSSRCTTGPPRALQGQIGLVLSSLARRGVLANPFWGHLADTRFGG